MRGAPVQGDSKITLPSRGETWRQFGSSTACARGVRTPVPRARVGFGPRLRVRAWGSGSGSTCARASACGYVRQRILLFRLRPSDRANRRDVFLFFVKFFKAFKSGNLFVS